MTSPLLCFSHGLAITGRLTMAKRKSLMGTSPRLPCAAAPEGGAYPLSTHLGHWSVCVFLLHAVVVAWCRSCLGGNVQGYCTFSTILVVNASPVLWLTASQSVEMTPGEPWDHEINTRSCAGNTAIGRLCRPPHRLAPLLWPEEPIGRP